MRNRYVKFLLSAILLTCLSAASLCADIPAPTVPADSENFTYVGRFSDDYRFAWSGCSIRFRIKGTGARAILTTGKEAAVLAVVDGIPGEKIVIDKEDAVYSVAFDLPDGEHDIEIVRTSEAYFGDIRFGGLILPEGTTMLAPPAPSERRILVIGDSITCAYGNEAKALEEGNSVRNQNAYLSYAMIAGRELKADTMLVCWSGRGLFRNRNVGDDKTDTLPQLFARTLSYDKSMLWEQSRFIPQVIAINLGTNDKNTEGGKKEPLKKEDYQAACREFVQALQETFPGVKIILTIGPMELKELPTWQAEVAAELENVYTLVYPNKGGKEYLGGHWHPSVKMQHEMAALLTAKVKEVMGW